MASVYLFIGPVIRNKSSVVTYTSRFDICKPLCSSNSTSSSSMGVDTAVNAKPLIVRRTANYQPSLWSFDHVQSLTSSKYTGEDIYATRAHVLKEEVKAMLPKDTTNVGNPLIKTLELVDDLQRLGISYHFEEDIRNVLEMIYHDYYKRHDSWNEMDLNLKSLGFRLLRQHGYQVPQDIFHNFMDEIQNLKPQSYEDMVSLLNLYEASYHSFEDESILDNVRDFTTRYLQENLENMDQSISLSVSHALELPLHWRVPRVEAKWFIQVYDQKRNGMNPTLIELARMDFNIVQKIHLEDLKDSSRWWRNMKWDQKLCFARDWLVENFLWTIGVSYLPHFSYGRRVLTKVNALITTIDDIYDVYGTLDELEKFTDVIDSWDINAIDEFPDYMKICFHGFYNTINEIAYNTLTDTGFHSLPFLKQAWTDLCKAYLVEAKWFHNRHTPTLEEYLDNACVSISAHVTLMHFNFLASTTSSAQIGQCMERADNIVRCSAQILRLSDDLGTSADEMERGDNSKSIQCYMHDTGGTEDEARTYLHELIMITWKKLNKERALCDNSQISREFIECATNIARMSQFMYGHGDWHGRPDNVTINHVLSLLCDPIQEI